MMKINICIITAICIVTCSCRSSIHFYTKTDDISPSEVFFQSCKIDNPIVIFSEGTYYIAPSSCMDILDTLNLKGNLNRNYSIFMLGTEEQLFMLGDGRFLIKEEKSYGMISDYYRYVTSILTWEQSIGNKEIYRFKYSPAYFIEALTNDSLLYIVSDPSDTTRDSTRILIDAEVNTIRYDTYRIHLYPVFKKSVADKIIKEYWDSVNNSFSLASDSGG